MPELPEVEVVRAGLERHIVGARIVHVDVLHPRPVRRHLAGADSFAAELTGRTFTGARRRGKYLWVPLDSGDALMAHLGMSGQLLVQRPGAPAERHLRVRFLLSVVEEVGQRPSRNPWIEEVAQRPSRNHRDGDARWSSPASASEPVSRPTQSVGVGLDTPSLVPRDGGSTNGVGLELRFVDQRMFGGLSVSVGGAELPPEIAHIARDPIDPLFDDDAFVRKVRRSASGIKRILLNQTVVSGIGNIYADEALWRAQLHGERPGERLSAAQVRDLLRRVRDVLGEALAQGGTSFDALYVNVNGESGYFDRSLHAYGREDQPCERCGTPIRRVAFMNRSSYFCPVCQPVPRRRRQPVKGRPTLPRQPQAD